MKSNLPEWMQLNEEYNYMDYDAYMSSGYLDQASSYTGPKTNAKRKQILQNLGISSSGDRIMEDRIIYVGILVIFLDYFKDNLKYDLWKNGTVLHLHGTGKYKEKNDVENLTPEDRALYYLDRKGREVHLFWAEKPDNYRYGQVLLRQNTPYQIIEEDEYGESKYIWVFPLLPMIAYKMDKKYWLPDSDVDKRRKIKKTDAEELYQNMIADEQILAEINGMDFDANALEFEYINKPREKQIPKKINGIYIYNRDKKVAFNALVHANFECEIDKKHPSFIRKNSSRKYMEPHHLVPLAYSKCFDVSLDVEENIVSLCSNCHNQLHYGKDAKKMLIKLYNERKERLKSVGIDISLEELLQMYETE